MARTLVFVLLSIPVQLARSEEVKCTLIPVETENGGTGYCCIFPKLSFKNQFIPRIKDLPPLRGFRDMIYPTNIHRPPFQGNQRLYQPKELGGNPTMSIEQVPELQEPIRISNSDLNIKVSVSNAENSNTKESNLQVQTFDGIFQYPYKGPNNDTTNEVTNTTVETGFESENNSSSNEETTTETMEMTTINLDNRNNVDARKTCTEGYFLNKQGQCKRQFG